MPVSVDKADVAVVRATGGQLRNRPEDPAPVGALEDEGGLVGGVVAPLGSTWDAETGNASRSEGAAGGASGVITCVVVAADLPRSLKALRW